MDSVVRDHELSGPVGDLLADAGKVAQVESRVLRGPELMVLASSLERVRALVDAAEAAVLGELAARSTTDVAVGMPTGTWLGHECGLPVSVGRTRVEVGCALRDRFGVMLEALRDGRVSWEHTRALVNVSTPRVVEQLVDLQDQLIDLAGECTFAEWTHQLKELVGLLDQDGSYDPEQDPEANRVSMVTTADGWTFIRGEFHGLRGVRLKTAIDREADRLFRRYSEEHAKHPDCPVPSRAALQAEAIENLIERGDATPVGACVPAQTGVILVAQASDTSDVRTLDGIRVQDGTTRVITANTVLYPLIVNSLGEPLDQGRRIRLANHAQRRALAVRDGGCTFPGCDAPPPWCRAHHIIHWDQNGPTDPPNLTLLCEHHHGVTHRRGWRVETHDHGHRWITPTGRTIWSQRYRRTTRPPGDGPP